MVAWSLNSRLAEEMINDQDSLLITTAPPFRLLDRVASMEDSPSPEPPAKLRTVCCIGDIHGYFIKLQSLWSNLEASIPPEDFQSALIIFLGDYCDRGPDTRRVIEFLISLPSRFPRQKHVFLSGNHDFAFAAFLRVLPPPPPDGADFKEGWKDYELDEDQEGWFKGEGYEQMHLQGRRWAGKIKVEFNSVKETYYQGSIYDAAPTFESYGVPHGSADLFRAVPEDHKKFLADLVWVHEEDGVHVETPEGIKKYRLIAVHAGLEKGKKVDKQLVALKAKDTRFPNVEALSGRKNVWDVPEELAEPPTIVVSGHHGKLHVDGLRLIIDEGGGYKDKPVAAVVLPSLRIVRSTVVARAHSTIKGTRTRVQSSSSKRRFAPDPIPFDESRFCSSESQHRFHIDRRQHYILERGFDFSENFGGAIPVGTLQSVVDKMQWSPFCSTFHTSDRVDCDIVREFFANLPDRRGNTVFVRGVWVDFSREVINSVVRAPPVEDHTFAVYASNLRNFTIDGLKRMVQQDGVGITVQTIHKSYLTPEALVWLHFICHTLMPSSHLTEVTRERLSLLYSIMSTEPVDVGSVVHSFIISPGRVRSYFFPAIITRLCHRAQVLLPMESTMSLMAPINGKAIKKMLHERGKAPSQSPSPAGPESPGPAPNEVEEKLEEERVQMFRPRSTLKDRVRKLEREVSHLRKLQVVQAGKMNRLLAHFGLSTEDEEEDRGPDDDLNDHPGSSDAMVDG